jgi:hypothetical protein
MKKSDVATAPKTSDPATVQKLYDSGAYLMTLGAFLKMLPKRLDEIELDLLPVLAKQGRRHLHNDIAGLCRRTRELAATPDGAQLIDELCQMGDRVPEGISTAFSSDRSRRSA